MRRALIHKSTLRLCQVALQDFPVHSDLEWRDCADDVAPETHTFNGNTFVLKPAPLAPPTVDLSDLENLDKAFRAMGRLIAQYTGKTSLQVRQDFITIYRTLP